MALVCTTAPIDKAVSVGDLKEWARIDSDNIEQNVMLGGLIDLATSWIGNFTGRTIMECAWTWTFDGFTSTRQIVHLPLPPVVSVTSVEYKQESDGAYTVFSDYDADTLSLPGRLYPSYQKTWPTHRPVLDAIRVTFKAGHADRANVPQEIKTAILMLATYLYENPDEGPGNSQESRGIPALVKQVLGPVTFLEVY